MLRSFVYTGTFDCEVMELLDVLHAADMFAMTELFSEAKNRLFAAIRRPEVAVPVWAQLLQRGLPSVEKEMEECHRQVLRMGSVALASSHLTELPLAVMEELVSSGVLRVDSEVDVFEACLRWARVRAGLSAKDSLARSRDCSHQADGTEGDKKNMSWIDLLMEPDAKGPVANSGAGVNPEGGDELLDSEDVPSGLIPQVRKWLDPLLPHIRFAHMTTQQLVRLLSSPRRLYCALPSTPTPRVDIALD